MIIRRLPNLVALLMVGTVTASCGYLLYLGCDTSPSPGQVPVVLSDGFTTAFEVRPEKAKTYLAFLNVQRSDLKSRMEDTYADLPEAAISMRVTILDALGSVRIERDVVVTQPFRHDQVERDWEIDWFALTTDPQTVRITILHVEPELKGLPGRFSFLGQYPKSCD